MFKISKAKEITIAIPIILLEEQNI